MQSGGGGSGSGNWFGKFAAETRSTTEWRSAMSSMVGEAQGVLAKHPRRAGEELTFLSDLSPAEQAALIDSIERGVLPQNVPYQRFCHETARRLDARLREIASERCSRAGTVRSRLSVMVDVASEGAAAILQQWPDRFDLLQATPLDGLPGPLRRQVWEMRLRQHLDAVASTDELKSTESDALVWNTCRDVVAMLGSPFLSSHVMPMKDVICHLRALHHGPVWTPLYLVLAPLLEVALGGRRSSQAPADGGMGGRERTPGARGVVPPWCMDRSSPKGAEDGRGMLRCFQALLRAAGLHEALRDKYTMSPKVKHMPPDNASLEPAWSQDGSRGGNAEWSALVYAVSDCLFEMDTVYHGTLCKMLHDAATQAEEHDSWRKPAEDGADAGNENGAAEFDAEALQRAIDKAWDLRPQTLLAMAANQQGAAPRDAHGDGGRGMYADVSPDRQGAVAAHVHPDGVAGGWREGGGGFGGSGLKKRRGAKDGKILGALVLPMVQRMFVGVIGSLETASNSQKSFLQLLYVVNTHVVNTQGADVLRVLCKALCSFCGTLSCYTGR